MITLLAGRAALWGTTVWEQKHHCCSSFQSFSEELKKVFDRASSGREAARELAELRQGDRSVTDYSIEFRTLAAECKWNHDAQWDMFRHGLADRIINEIYTQELPTSLDGLIDLAIRVDARLQRRGQRALLTGGLAVKKSSSAATFLPVQLLVDRTTFTCKALIDSGAEGNFLDHKTALRLRIPLVPLDPPILVTALSGQSLPPVTHVTESVSLITSGNHTETISFLLTDSPLAPVVLGHPWLSRHNPNINWSQNTVLSWSEYCHASCLLSACSSVSCSVLQDEGMALSNVPAVSRNGRWEERHGKMRSGSNSR
jgi:hypothetical protein